MNTKDPAWSVVCPDCGVGVRVVCRWFDGSTRSRPHKSRTLLAREQAHSEVTDKAQNKKDGEKA